MHNLLKPTTIQQRDVSREWQQSVYSAEQSVSKRDSLAPYLSHSARDTQTGCVTREDSPEIFSYNGNRNGSLTVREFVTIGQNKNRLTKTPMRYHPNTRMHQVSVLKWANLPKKDSFLDDLMKSERKKIGPVNYSQHKIWTNVLNNVA